MPIYTLLSGAEECGQEGIDAWFLHLADREEIFLQGFRVCGLTMNTGGTAVGLARTEDKFVDRNTRHC